MKIARVFLNLQESKSQIDDGDKWNNHRKSIRKLYEINPSGYISRIRDIVDTCIEEKIELLILPACTLYYSNAGELKKYLHLFKNVPLVHTGVLYDKFHSHDESANIIINGEVIHVFNNENIHLSNYKDVNFISAISSTIKKTKELKENTSLSRKPVIIVDMGHHQYNGRYMRTLKSVSQHIKNKFNIIPFTVLSFWKFNNASLKADWFVSGKKLGFKRITRNNDFIDILDV